MVDPTLSIDRLIRYGWFPAWDLHWPKRRCTTFHAFDEFAPSAWMMTNRILTGYCPLGSGSGPIGALLMGSRMNGYNIEFSLSLILLNSWEWFAALVLNRYYSCVFESILSRSRLRDTSVVDKKYRSKSSRHSSTDGDLSLPLPRSIEILSRQLSQ